MKAAAEKMVETKRGTTTVVDMEAEADTEATEMTETEMSHGQKVVALVQAAFQ